jgi:hypothetical protein
MIMAKCQLLIGPVRKPSNVQHANRWLDMRSGNPANAMKKAPGFGQGHRQKTPIGKFNGSRIADFCLF